MDIVIRPFREADTPIIRDLTVDGFQGVYIDEKTAATRWAGERMDYDLAIFGLFSSLARAKRVSAETSQPQSRDDQGVALST